MYCFSRRAFAKWTAFLVMVSSLLPSVYAASSTAFDLIKEGNRYVGEPAKDKIVQIRSEKSIGSITPNIWYVVFYDPTATLKATRSSSARAR
jgi:hypothetical protein